MTSTLHSPVAVLFDLGGTLLVEESYDLAAGIEALHREQRIELERSPEAEAVCLIDSISSVHADGTAEFIVWQWLCDVVDPRLDLEHVKALESELWRHTVRLSPMPGAVELLDDLHSRAIRSAVLSNTIFRSDVVCRDSAFRELGDRFEFVVTSADIGLRKPSPAIFDEALTRLDLRPNEVWFVGDSWEADVRGAAGVGMHSVWLSRSERVHEDGSACSVIADLYDLRRLLDAAQSA